MLRAGQIIHLLVIATLALAVIAVHGLELGVGKIGVTHRVQRLTTV